ncbi:glyceraldehyde-3-phosphate dehydrogenase [Flavobacterium rhizosphaerae]|uniref:Glyceraldehyde-3-phosphate dehydrogenase n=1 Tax=Flavobacterium rhizosphaerae TaxID=3163298 RepID=A0ABW8YWJ0_9FLAO
MIQEWNMECKTTFSTEAFEQQKSAYIKDVKKAITLQGLINQLWYTYGIEIMIFHESLIQHTPGSLLQLLEEINNKGTISITIENIVQVVQAIQPEKLHSGILDIGDALLIPQTNTEGQQQWLNKHYDALFEDRSKDVILFGFGRIGRLVARTLIERMASKTFRLRAIVIRGSLDAAELEKRASLLRTDSVHGSCKAIIKVDYKNKSFIINGIQIPVIAADNPRKIDYTEYGIKNALVIDSSGAFRDKENLQRHLAAFGVSQVLLTAPGKGIPNIVFGVNHHNYNPDEDAILSAASCTTNAIAPVLKAMHETFGIVSGHMETIHAYTNDQNLVDNMHAKNRRGRAAALNMVITETGAGKAIAKVLPELEGKLTSNAIRVPIPNGSLAILHLKLQTATNINAINAALRGYAFEGILGAQLQYEISDELVSSDIVGNNRCAVYDSKATIIDNSGHDVTLYIWYDNEYGYTQQVIRIAQMMCQPKYQHILQ